MGGGNGLRIPPPAGREGFVLDALMADPVAVEVLRRAQGMGLPDHALMAGAVYKAVWNAMTGRSPGHGVNDYDLAYFDPSDLSYEAEDRVIRAARPVFADLPVPVEVCNQARVHIWFNEKYGTDRAPLRDTEDALRHFASRVHSVAVRLDERGRPELLAPFGLEALFSGEVRPVPGLSGREGWAEKCRSQAKIWPELRFVADTDPV